MIATSIQDLYATGWTAERASLYDEEGVEGWRWFDADGEERCTLLGNWDDGPPMPDEEITL